MKIAIIQARTGSNRLPGKILLEIEGKTMLEHIAVHRTIDIRQESRGKVHLLGRVYRKIFEPICYIVGKYGK